MSEAKDIKLVDGQEIFFDVGNGQHKLFRHKCCDCGLRHKVYIGRNGNEITLSFVRESRQKKNWPYHRRYNHEQGKMNI